MSRGPDKQFDRDVALAKAMQVFWARGYEAASLSQLLEQMGIGRKSLYDTFGNKRSLFFKALEHYAQTQIKSMREQLLQAGSPLANLERVLKTLLQVHSQPGSHGCLLGTSIADFDTSICKRRKMHITSLFRVLKRPVKLVPRPILAIWLGCCSAPLREWRY
jgi:TetR/AcrR family transcriptional regulator, transcriptional repressor for nem operon